MEWAHLISFMSETVFRADIVCVDFEPPCPCWYLSALVRCGHLACVCPAQEALHKLWEVGFPGEPYPQNGRSKRWTDMGWQRDDPTSDFRGGGFFSLQLLLSLGQVHMFCP